MFQAKPDFEVTEKNQKINIIITKFAFHIINIPSRLWFLKIRISEKVVHKFE